MSKYAIICIYMSKYADKICKYKSKYGLDMQIYAKYAKKYV